jgi:uncharacterized membrane protein YjjP (DUF1212 family)
MNPPARTWYAPVLDGLAIVTFILVGKGEHDIDEGIEWFLTVFWPLALGWGIVALLTKLYQRTSGIWLALGITIVAGILLGAIPRGLFTDRPYISIFTVVAIAYLGIITYGWRLIAAVLSSRRARRRPATA